MAYPAGRFRSHSPQRLYDDLVAETMVRIERFQPSRPYEYDAFFWDTGLAQRVEAIPRREVELQRKARFLRGILYAVGTLQRKAAWEQARLESESLASGDGVSAVNHEAVFLRVLLRDDVQLQRSVLREGIGSAIAVLRDDPEVDLKVASDLGHAGHYPARAPLPPPGDGFTAGATERVRIFWRTVLPVPLYPQLDPRARGSARTLQPVSPA